MTTSPTLSFRLLIVTCAGIALIAAAGCQRKEAPAVEAELTRLLSSDSLAEGGIAQAWPAGGAVPDVPAAAIRLNAGARPAEIGGQIARSVYGGIGRKP